MFAEIKPHQRKELMRLVVDKAMLSRDYMKIHLSAGPPQIGLLTEVEPRFQAFR